VAKPKASWPQLKLKGVLSNVVSMVVKQMKSYVRSRRAIDGGTVHPLRESTLLARKAHGIIGSTRLRATGALLDKGIKSEVKDMSLLIYLSDETHPGLPANGKRKAVKSGATFAEVGAYNQKDNPDVNTGADTHNWWGVTDETNNISYHLIREEVLKQLSNGARFSGEIPVKLKV